RAWDPRVPCPRVGTARISPPAAEDVGRHALLRRVSPSPALFPGTACPPVPQQAPVEPKRRLPARLHAAVHSAGAAHLGRSLPFVFQGLATRSLVYSPVGKGKKPGAAGLSGPTCHEPLPFFPGPLCARISHYLAEQGRGKASRTMTEPEPSEKVIFWEAIEVSAAERAAYLERACAGRPQLRAAVEALLHAHEGPQRLLDATGSARPAVGVGYPLEGPGTVIGPYKLREQIGEGGMGLVFVAEQQQPVRRKVALKVIKPGMDSKQVIARFEAERQALALMDHPHIAKVFDGGTTPSGRPYFVMELVKGVPITQSCDDHRRTPRERLGLFVSVCQAVQHAHQKGIIHRDLKPPNVLVTMNDDTPVAKVIDFGVAKAVGGQLTDKTVYTQLTQLVGTPLYMSPEQAGQSVLNIAAPTDIYA